MDVSESDMELLQFVAAIDHDIFSEVVFLNLYKLRTTNESCKCFFEQLYIYYDKHLLYLYYMYLYYIGPYHFYAATSDK